jgi:hypothetical protein
MTFGVMRSLGMEGEGGVRPDPRPRKDGLCVVCRKKRVFAKNKLKGVDPKIYERDAFCSTDCCKVWHGVTTSGISTGKVAA